MATVRFVLLSALLCFASVLSAAEPPCIGLVLGGGGARGAAHIGVLKVLERERVPICAIAGTSMGAIVGSLYAVGYTPDQIETILTSIDWKDVFRDDPDREALPMRRKQEDFRYLLGFKFGFRDGQLQLPRGVVQGQKLNLLLRRLLLPAWEVEDFDRLPVPFRCVGADIGAGQGVVFGSGDLAMAVRASMSVPGAFAPVRVNGRLMVDGGIVDNVPVDVVRNMGAERVIVVDVGAPLLDESALNSPFAISMQMISMLMQQRTDSVLASLAPSDVVLRPELGALGSADFDRAVEGIAPGMAAAEAQLPALQAMSLSQDAYAAHQAARPRLDFDAPLVEFLRVVDTRTRTAGYVADRLGEPAVAPLDLDTLEASIGRAYGQGAYERIDWRLRREGQRTGVVVQPVDKGWGPNFITFGLQISDDFDGESNYALAVESTLSGFNQAGGEWRNRLELGQVTGLRTEFFQPWGRHGRWFVQPSLRYRAFEQPLTFAGEVFADYRVSEAVVEIESGMAIGELDQLSARLIGGRDQARRRVGLATLPRSIDTSFAGIGLRWLHDSLDDADFPGAGQRISLNAEFYRPRLGTDGDGESVQLVWDSAFSRGRHHLLLGGRLALRDGVLGPSLALNTLGGFANLSGVGERQLLDDQAALARAVYYRRFGDMDRLFSVPAYLGATLEGGGVWARRSDVFSSPVLAGSLFLGLDSPFGPIFFAYGRDDAGEQALHLTFGSLLRP